MRKEKGSLTVEACISFVTFLLITCTLLGFIKVIYTYGLIQHALNQAVAELSEYSYIYCKTLGDIDDTIQSATAAGTEKFNGDVDTLVNTYTSLTDFAGDVGDTVSDATDLNINALEGDADLLEMDYEEVAEQIGFTRAVVNDIITHPQTALKSLGSTFLNIANENIKTVAFGEITRALMSGYIKTDSKSSDERLKGLQVSGGLSGLNFSGSSIMSDGSKDIDIVVCYTIDMNLPINFMNKVVLSNRAKVRVWGG